MNCIINYKTYENVYLKIDSYSADNSLAITIMSEIGERLAVITVCLKDLSLEENESYVDTNHCPWALDFIKEYGLGESTDKAMSSGYCIYPMVRFNIERLLQYTK